MDRDGLPPAARDAQSWTREFDTVRVEWERAGWMHADDLAGELRAKANLIRWHLRSLLADLTGDVTQHYEAVLARPDLPTARAALGCALPRTGRIADALPPLRAAVTAQPFHRAPARALAPVLSAAGEKDAVTALEAERRLL